MLIVLHGSDEFTARAALTAILADPRYAGNVERFEGTSADIRDVRAACATLPFLSEARLIVIEGLPKPKRGSRDAEEESDAPARGKKGSKKPSAAAQARDFVAALADLAQVIPDTTTLAIFIPEELPKTNPLLAAAERYGELRAFVPPSGGHLDAWIARRARDEGVAIAPDALRQLAALTTGNLRLLANEIAKLATYVGPKGTITLAAVELLVPDVRETKIFELTDALTRGDRAQALALVHASIDEGSPPLMLLAMIARQVRVLLQAKDLAARGARQAEIASVAGIAPFQVERILAQARRLSVAQLQAAQRACLEVDTAVKRSRLAPDLALDLLITDFGTHNE